MDCGGVKPMQGQIDGILKQLPWKSSHFLKSIPGRQNWNQYNICDGTLVVQMMKCLKTWQSKMMSASPNTFSEPVFSHGQTVYVIKVCLCRLPSSVIWIASDCHFGLHPASSSFTLLLNSTDVATVTTLHAIWKQVISVLIRFVVIGWISQQ